jgi:formylglycine-generating enzyme required for sulfatase activity
MVVIPGGTFQIGSPTDELERGLDEGPQQRVTIEPFAVGRVEVTFAEWDACVAANGCGGYSPSDQGWGRGDRPVINVSWDDAQSYVTWLSGKTGKRYRLLTEAEWEYATRAGSVTPFATGEQVRPDQAQYDWKYSYGGSPTRTSSDAKTAPVASFPANPFGLHDVHGNVSEWVQDCYRSGQSAQGAAHETADCAASGSGGTQRVLRGGSWKNNPMYLRSASRNRLGSVNRFDFVGFRVARML